MFGEPFHRLGEGAGLSVLSDGDEFSWRPRMVDAHHILLDDGPFVEVTRDEVGGRTDELHPTRVRLAIRVRTLEPGKEGVMDVDHAAGKRITQFWCEHLHVPREDDELDVVLLHRV